jgi:hypothetical protein
MDSHIERARAEVIDTVKAMKKRKNEEQQNGGYGEGSLRRRTYTDVESG